MKWFSHVANCQPKYAKKPSRILSIVLSSDGSFKVMGSSVEEWRQVPEWPYEASHMGNIRRLGHDKRLKPWLTKNGYLSVSLSRQNKKTNHSVHRLVWMAFRGSIGTGFVINHLDGIKTNSALANLELVTPKENTAHAIRTKLFSMGANHHVRLNPAKYTFGSNNGFSKHSERTVLLIKQRLARGERAVDIAKSTSLDANWIRQIKCGRLWKHVTLPQSDDLPASPVGVSLRK